MKLERHTKLTRKELVCRARDIADLVETATPREEDTRLVSAGTLLLNTIELLIESVPSDELHRTSFGDIKTLIKTRMNRMRKENPVTGWH